MITAERLEELIKQGAKIYQISYNSFLEIPLINNKENHFDIYHNRLHIHELEKYEYWWDNRWTDCYIELDKLFETKERAEWALKTTAKRTERFEPPMWEDIKDYYCFNFVVDNCHRCFVVKKYNWITIDSDGCNNIFEKYASDVTKENYIMACEIVRDLFNKGGAK